MDRSNLPRKNTSTIWLAMKEHSWIFIFVFVIWLVGAGAAFIGGTEGSNEFGDAFGWVSALFSGLAFAGLIVTLAMQREELELAREEYIRQGDELGRQADLIAEQGKILNEQILQGKRRDFEDGFFNRLALFNECRQAYEPWDRKFAKYKNGNYADIGDSNLPIAAKLGCQHEPSDKEAFQSEINEYARTLRSVIKPYFNQFRDLCQFIHDADMTEERKEGYISILRNQLTQEELALHLYNAISHDGRGMRSYVANFNMLFYFSGNLKSAHIEAHKYFERNKENWAEILTDDSEGGLD